jgi:hypothetical protein
MSYTLIVPSLNFAGFLSIWANEYRIPISHNVVESGTRSNKSTKVPKRCPVIIAFENATDRTSLMGIAQAKIAALHAAQPYKGSRWGRKANRRPPEVTAIAARLQADYDACQLDFNGGDDIGSNDPPP